MSVLPNLPDWTGQVAAVHLFLRPFLSYLAGTVAVAARARHSPTNRVEPSQKKQKKQQHFWYRRCLSWILLGGKKRSTRRWCVGGGSECHLWRTTSSGGSNERFEGVSCRRKRRVTRRTVVWARAPFKVHWNYVATPQGNKPASFFLHRG